jgi:hypothetical protein
MGVGRMVLKVPAWKPSVGLSRTAKMVAQQQGQIKRVIHFKFSVIAGVVQTAAILLFAKR